jgi:hypothetical protein
MPWRYDEEKVIKEKISSRGLTLGYYSCDGNVRFTLYNLSGMSDLP